MAINWISTWRIRAIDGLQFDAMDLYRAHKASGAPSCLNWYFDNTVPYAARDTGTYGVWPFGTEPGTIILFSPDNPKYSPKNAMGLCYTGQDVISCLVESDETDLDIGNRIYHEIIHGVCNCGNPDGMTSTDVAEFCQYLRDKYGATSSYASQFCTNPNQYAHSSAYQKDFYEMLGRRYFPWCFPGGGLPPPEADFSATLTSGVAPFTVMFIADCENAETLTWEFGDGSVSTQTHPSHTYTQAGWYDVRLTASNTNGSDTKIRYDFIHVTENLVQPIANFTGDPRTGAVPLTVQFFDTTTGDATNFQWEFGDGGMSTARNPVHTYGVAKSYDVKLSVWNPQDPPDSITKRGYIVASPYEPPTTDIVPDFSVYPKSGKAPLSVSFEDLSTGTPTWWNWDFGDGVTSTLRSPQHTYSVPGTYAVTLTVGNAIQTKVMLVENAVTVTGASGDPSEVLATFKFGPSKGFAPLTVFFSDMSSGNPTSWKWNFGDGTESMLKSPVHTYIRPGYYDVTLQVNNGQTTDGVTVNHAIMVMDTTPISVSGGELLPFVMLFLSIGGLSYGIGVSKKR